MQWYVCFLRMFLSATKKDLTAQPLVLKKQFLIKKNRPIEIDAVLNEIMKEVKVGMNSFENCFLFITS